MCRQYHTAQPEEYAVVWVSCDIVHQLGDCHVCIFRGSCLMGAYGADIYEQFVVY